MMKYSRRVWKVRHMVMNDGMRLPRLKTTRGSHVPIVVVCL
jgi:hypothetical protein